LLFVVQRIEEHVKSNHDDAILDGDKPPHHGAFPTMDDCPTTKAGKNAAAPGLEQTQDSTA